jgi:hypothetical protein
MRVVEFDRPTIALIRDSPPGLAIALATYAERRSAAPGDRFAGKGLVSL